MPKFQSMEKIVSEVLEGNLQARKDDYVLMLCVCEKICPEILNYPFWVVMKNHYTNKLPNWETVSRCRRKIQEKRPDLVSSETPKNNRKTIEMQTSVKAKVSPINSVSTAMVIQQDDTKMVAFEADGLGDGQVDIFGEVHQIKYIELGNTETIKVEE